MDIETILSELFECSELDKTDWNPEDFSVLADLIKLIKATLSNDMAEFDQDDLIIDILLDNFADTHPIWNHVCY